MNSLDLFGKYLIEETRDRTFKTISQMVNGTMKGVTAQKVNQLSLFFSRDQINALYKIVLISIDYSLGNLLTMVEQNDEIVVLCDGENIKELSDGLSGELYTEDGWIERFSQIKSE